MMSFTFGLFTKFTKLSDLGPHGPFVLTYWQQNIFKLTDYCFDLLRVSFLYWAQGYKTFFDAQLILA